MTFTYELRFEDGRRETFEVALDPETLVLKRAEGPRPAWAALDFEKCPHCPLSEGDCPLAAALPEVVDFSRDQLSYTPAQLEVRSPERSVSARTTVQKALASLMGLLMATSDCPHTRLLRPMARFHLPLATEEETIYRAASMYMLARFFAGQSGEAPGLEGLAEAYQALQVVNKHVAKRLRAAVKLDASINAVVVLDVFSKAMPYAVEDQLEEIRYLFEPWLSQRG